MDGIQWGLVPLLLVVTMLAGIGGYCLGRFDRGDIP